MRLDEMMNKENCEEVWGYRPTENELAILNNTNAMRETLIAIWENKK